MAYVKHTLSTLFWPADRVIFDEISVLWYFIRIKTPVIIPAFNEALNITATLDSLPNDLVEPIVAVNGSTDETAILAKEFGCQVLDLTEQGKLPAIQTVLSRIGDRALEPVLILDADTRPIFPRHWALGMTKNMSLWGQDIPEAVGCPVWYTQGDLLSKTVRTLWRYRRAIQTQGSNSASIIAQCGPNMGLHLKDRTTLDAILSLPHYWPSEDRAMMATVLANSGRVTQPLSPATMTFSPLSDSVLPVVQAKKVGDVEATKRMFDHYAQRGAPGSRPFAL